MNTNKKNMIRSLKGLIEKFDPKKIHGKSVVIYDRSSSRAQLKTNNHLDRIRCMKNEVIKAGGHVIKVVKEVGSAKAYNLEKRMDAGKLARKNNAIILFESLSRLVRHNDCYRGDVVWRDMYLTVKKLKKKCFPNTDLVSLHDPDSSPKKEKSMQTKRGIEAKKAKSEDHRNKHSKKIKKPGDMKRRREKLIKLVKQRRKNGSTYKEMEKYFDVKDSTLCDWCKRKEN